MLELHPTLSIPHFQTFLFAALASGVLGGIVGFFWSQWLHLKWVITDSSESTNSPNTSLHYWPALLTALFFMAVVSLYGLTLQFVSLSFFGATLIALSAIDLRTLLLPDALTQPLLWAGLMVAALGWGVVDLPTSLWGAVAGYGVLWSVAALFKALTGQDGMGQGDFKLLAAIGAWLGWPALLPILLLASTSGAVAGLWLRQRTHHRTGEEARYIPFGPFLAGAAILLALWPTIPLIPQVTW